MKKSINDKEMFDEVVQIILSVMGDDVISRRNWDSTEKHNVYDVIAKLNLKYDTLFSIVIIDEKRFNKWLFDLSFYYSIDEEGIVLWKREAA